MEQLKDIIVEMEKDFIENNKTSYYDMSKGWIGALGKYLPKLKALAEQQKDEVEIQKMADETYWGSECIELLDWMLKNKIHPEFITQSETKWVARNVNNKDLGFYGEATSLQLYQKYKSIPSPVKNKE